MATGKIKTLFSDKEKTEALFPRTKVSAISDDDGAGLDAILDNMNTEIDTKATEAFVTNKIAEAQLSGGSGGNIDLSGYATKDDIRNIDFPVDSVNGKTGAVTLSAEDIGALPISGGIVTGNSDTSLYLKSGTVNSYIGFKNFSDKILGYLGIAEDGTPIFYDTGVKTLLHVGNIASFAAPPDYGLGATTPPTITTTEQLDATFTSGFYRYAIFGSKVGGIGLNFGSLIVYTVNGNECVHELRPLNTNCCLRRYWYNGTWSEWEVENPPMSLGVEYRTTERWEGKPVYTKLVSLGAFTNPMVVTLPGYSAMRVIEAHGELRMTENSDNTLTVPGRFGNNEVWIDQSFAYSQQLRFRSTDGWDWPIGRPFYLRLKYWKYTG